MQINISDMAEDIKLSKTDNQPWGFRVTGGLDFGTPVTVIKVTAGSLAEQAGLKVGDMLLQANGQPLSFLTHYEYSKFLQEAGNFIELSIIRGSLVLPPPLASPEPTVTGTEINDLEKSQNNGKPDVISNTEALPPSEPSLFESIFGPLEKQEDVKCVENVIQELSDQPAQPTDTTMDDLTKNNDAVTSPLSESAAENTDTTISVQQPALESQPPSLEHDTKEQTEEIIHEEVKRDLTEEEIADIMVGHAEVLKGTTIGVDFDKLEPKTDVTEKSQVLQVLKEDEGEPVRKLSTFLQIPNRPKIKPKEKPEQSAVPPKMMEKQTEDVISQEVSDKNEEEPTEGDQQNNAEDVKESEVNEREQLEEIELTAEQKEETKIHTEPVEQPQSEEPEKVNDDTLLEIQSQLTALLQLPVVMQQQLSIIQQQLTSIVQKKVADLNPASTAEDNDTKEEEETVETHEEGIENNEQEKIQHGSEEKEILGEEQEAVNTNNNAGDQVMEGETVKSVSVEDNQDMQPENGESESTEITEETKEERKHDIKWQREKPKKNKPFFPLTPHPRPIVLPGRIKFQMNPEEAYSDDFIAETLSGNAEVIKGTTIGVNFQKYHQSFDHLKSSSVYRMIHETEKRQPGAFEGRPVKIPALEDYKQLLQNAKLEEA